MSSSYDLGPTHIVYPCIISDNVLTTSRKQLAYNYYPTKLNTKSHVDKHEVEPSGFFYMARACKSNKSRWSSFCIVVVQYLTVTFAIGCWRFCYCGIFCAQTQVSRQGKVRDSSLCLILLHLLLVSLSIAQVNQYLDDLALSHVKKDKPGVKRAIQLMLRNTSAQEQKWLIRIIMKVIMSH